MILALALALVASPAERSGRVAIVSEPFVFDAGLARELCPEPAARVTVRIGASAVDPLARLPGPSASLDIDAKAARPGDDPALATRVAGARCIVLEGGTWLEWWHALRPYGKQSELGRALVAAHAGGANVIGVGPSGAHLAALCVLSRATLERPSRDPHAAMRDVVLGGLGLARGACIDFATDGRVDPERSLEAAFDAHVDLAVWLAGPCAWIQDERSHTATVAGPGAAFVFDARPARRSRDVIESLRTARIRAGGTFDLALRVAGHGAGAPEERPAEYALTSTATAFFAAPNPENGWYSRKVLAVTGEGHVLRFVFDPPSDTDPIRPATGGLECARLDWLPRVRQRPRRRAGFRSQPASHDLLVHAQAFLGHGHADARRGSWRPGGLDSPVRDAGALDEGLRARSPAGAFARALRRSRHGAGRVLVPGAVAERAGHGRR